MNEQQREQIAALYVEMYDGMMTFAQLKLKEESQAEEAVQEAFRIACLRAEQMLQSPNPRGWLVNTLKFTIKNITRSRESTRLLLSRYLATQSDAVVFSEDKVSLEVLYENVADLEEFKLIKELAVDGKTQLELAENRGITLAACKKRVQRAKKTLQRKL